jgi:hypothetical protein
MVMHVTRAGPVRFETKGRTEELFVTRALRSQGLWLTLTYIALLLLMSRAYS